MLATRDLTNRDIAARLCLSVRTVEVHIDHILTKLGFRARTRLAAWAHEEGRWPDRKIRSAYLILQMTCPVVGRNAGGMNEVRVTRRSARRDCQLLAVGAGPAGLALAARASMCVLPPEGPLTGAT
jgi:hypothetical protein